MRSNVKQFKKPKIIFLSSFKCHIMLKLKTYLKLHGKLE